MVGQPEMHYQKSCIDNWARYLRTDDDEEDVEAEEGRPKPYLPHPIRSRLHLISHSVLARFYRPGEVIHVGMDGVEAGALVRWDRRCFRKRQSRAWDDLAHEFPGRQGIDLEAFIEDLQKGTTEEAPTIIVMGEAAIVMTKPKPARTERRSRQRISRPLLWQEFGVGGRGAPELLGGYQLVTCWAGCSGAVTSLATPGSILPAGLQTCMIGSTTETDAGGLGPGLTDPYNRPGELCGIELGLAGLRCRVINGHWMDYGSSQQPEQQHQFRSTVSCVVHSESNSAYLSGGYDGTVACWSDEQMALLSRFGLHQASDQPVHPGHRAINTLAVDTRSYGLVYGTAGGELVWCADPLGKDETGRTPLTVVAQVEARALAPGQTMPLADAVDVIALACQRAPLTAFAGYGYRTAFRSGLLQAYDLGNGNGATGTLLHSLPIDGHYCLTDVALSPEVTELALATGCLVESKGLGRGDGIIRLWDVRTASTSTGGEGVRWTRTMNTGQRDIHSVSFSPCSRLLYSVDIETGQMLVHDLRNLEGPLWSHNHSLGTASCAQQLVGHAWYTPSNGPWATSYLLTGGNDGILRFWDLSRPTDPVDSYDLGYPINSLAVSADGSTLWGGTDSGTVIVLSQNQSLAKAAGDHPVILHDPSLSR